MVGRAKSQSKFQKWRTITCTTRSMTDNVTFPDWLPPYLERSEILGKLANWLKEGKSDEDIARMWNSTAEKVHDLRTHWSMIRDGECPHCGDKRYDWDKKECPNRRCITNWYIPPHWREGGKKKGKKGKKK